MQTVAFTDEQWWAACDANLGRPIPLVQADLTQPFVYERKWGVFYVPFGMHQMAMATLLAFQFGETSYLNIERDGEGEPRFRDTYKATDYWLQNTPGAAFQSGIGRHNTQIWSFKGMTPVERQLFANAYCVRDA